MTSSFDSKTSLRIEARFENPELRFEWFEIPIDFVILFSLDKNAQWRWTSHTFSHALSDIYMQYEQQYCLLELENVSFNNKHVGG